MPNKPKIFAHRGISSLYPENSLIALEKMLELKVDGCEFDVELSKDNIPVLIHQETFAVDRAFKKISPSKSLARKTWTQKYTWAELQGLDTGSWLSKEFEASRIINLESALNLNWGRKSALIELKDVLYWDSDTKNEYHERIVKAVSENILDFRIRGGDPYILSFSPQILKIAAEEIPDAPRVQNASSLKAIEAALLRKDFSFHVICTSETVLLNSPNIVKKVHDAGLRFFVYEHTNYKTKPREESLIERKLVWEEFAKLEVDGIISNFSEAYN